MECKYFGKCGSCSLYEGGYEEQLQKKVHEFEKLFGLEPEIFPSKQSRYRARAEFRYIDGEYAMHRLHEKGLVTIDACEMVLESIYELMSKLRLLINKHEILSNRLYRVDFLSGLSGESLVTMVYHRPIDEAWEKAANEIAKALHIDIVGRSRGKKIVIGKEYITEKLPVFEKEFLFRHYEGSFTQPNPYVNIKMIEWAGRIAKDLQGDLLELYCGAGNFTLPLSRYFEKVLATEVNKSSIKAAKENVALNGIENVEFVRLSSQEVTQALRGVRDFRRLENIDLHSYNFQTVFVDPPRCGLDDDTRELVREFDNIVYISCNPQTLHRDLEELSKTHTVQKVAVFDQFPYTPHLESGVYLTR
ncbi:tRNA (uridine(54)-C5)-methyltransferase TrmA [Nitratiruptor sp. SB155-2]|uniref:tRNA/tmRNA (uracil-C(5))-methyltransferase n=1 Tax=Nitratiruptor sp. (strain SB155-2) TaxID=387092 RepID=TRMA_NITSB|nr:tRNA (uridine(54)-C5)-methyltransferase TrmA [Nitratiruptor sp. SB155-2]A6Q2V7.1 RecName: Full=tRNA/tmRNA (uracil-C(5))-methyltransferase; AltName: Full=tRNA (uracil(54)-C(5))-methyltransferase; AltName: Full=tRNA(m5U54)-methyltransferase; Short=RUMT; AltName: Full=tmRNA (uracil(341)-C(5))-methyltransferase [Nitratiruptor sp. SB155-2]BAF69816.1 tRNA (uracil-5-)-methyltransferase [Nitratiruptor sp. SB155-2]